MKIKKIVSQYSNNNIQIIFFKKSDINKVINKIIYHSNHYNKCLIKIITFLKYKKYFIDILKYDIDIINKNIIMLYKYY
jgi:hypothetical protein